MLEGSSWIKLIGCCWVSLLSWPTRVLAGTSFHRNMNDRNGDDEKDVLDRLYQIANSESYDTRFESDTTEYFEVSSNVIRTLYGQVHWRAHESIPLPREIIRRFENNKVMAVVGYEVDQVFEGQDQDVRVPISWAYNHHYGAFLHNSKAIQLQFQHDNDQPMPVVPKKRAAASHGKHFETILLDDRYQGYMVFPLLQFFSEGNGGEMRASWHGYPQGYAQLIQSPDTFTCVPMQIDTWDRQRMTNATYVPGAPLPRQFLHSEAPKFYNPLLECPCSDRLPKFWNMTYHAIVAPPANDDHDLCIGPIENDQECWQAAQILVPATHLQYHSISTEVDPSLPPGCSVTVVQGDAQDSDEDLNVRVVWNSANQEEEEHQASPIWTRSNKVTPDSVAFGRGAINVTVALFHEHDLVEITLTGPANSWLGIGFGTNNMCWHMQSDECPGGGPYAIVVSGDTVVERKLAYHGPGVVLPSSLTVISNTVTNQGIDLIRTVVLERSMKGPSDQYYAFEKNNFGNNQDNVVPIILAKGCGLEFAQHCGHGPAELVFLPFAEPVTLCQGGIQGGTIGGNQFVEEGRCQPFPISDLIRQKNPTCSVRTYVGGLVCCRDGQSLLDQEQEQPWADQYLEYRLVFRFYFQEYQPAIQDHVKGKYIKASHAKLVRLYHQTEHSAGEYDIPECPAGTPVSQCVHVITAQWKVRDMMVDCADYDASWCTGKGSSWDNTTAGVKLIYAAPHCHAGTCLSMELYNADTGDLLCRMEPRYGRDSSQPYEEEHYLAIPPCLWSEWDPERLPQPVLLSLDTTLLSIKQNNNSFSHTGEMASWQMRGIVVTKQEQESLSKKNKANTKDVVDINNGQVRKPDEMSSSFLLQSDAIMSNRPLLRNGHASNRDP